MKVRIDQALCTGDGLCENIAPDVFTVLGDGLGYVIDRLLRPVRPTDLTPRSMRQQKPDP